MSSLQAFYSGAFTGTTPTLTQVLSTGNIASTDINMAQNDLINVASIQNSTAPIIVTAPLGVSLSGSVGSAGQVLTSNASAQPTWQPIVLPVSYYIDTLAGTSGDGNASTFTTITSLPAGYYLFTANFVFLNTNADVTRISCYLQKPDTTYININRIYQTASGTATTAQQSYTISFVASNNTAQNIAVQMLVDTTSKALFTANLFGFTYTKLAV